MVQVGTPPQDFPVAIDSGSGDLDIAGKGCVGCVTTPPNHGYDPDASTTSTLSAPYTFSNTYETCDLKHPTAPCTITGKVYQDKVSLAGLGPVDVKLGSILKQTDNFDQFKEIDGVMGFIGNGDFNVFKQLVKAEACDPVWAMCMHEGTRSNGTLTIGGVDERLSDGPVAYVPDGGQGFSEVEVSGIKIGDVTVQVGQNAILDTGTNILLLPQALLASVKNSMCTDTSLPGCAELWSDQCLSLTDKEVDAYPPLSLQLHGLSLEMTSRDYLLLGSPMTDVAGQYCLGIRSGGDMFIIGDTTMRHYYLVFDGINRRVGWGKVNKYNCGSIDDSSAVEAIV